MIWPLNLLAPVASLISTLCGTPRSLLANSRTNAWPAGASSWLVSNWIFWAAMRSVEPAAAALPDGPGVADTDPDAGGAVETASALAAGLMSKPAMSAVDGAVPYTVVGVPAPAAAEQAETTIASTAAAAVRLSRPIRWSGRRTAVTVGRPRRQRGIRRGRIREGQSARHRVPAAGPLRDRFACAARQRCGSGRPRLRHRHSCRRSAPLRAVREN